MDGQVGQTEARLAAYAAAFGAAAQSAGVITDAEAGLLSKSLVDARRGWERLSAAWPKHLVEPRPSDADLADESKNVRTALDAATRDGIQWARPDVIAARVDLPVVLADVRTAMRGSRALVVVAYLISRCWFRLGVCRNLLPRWSFRRVSARCW